jgi:hypothetical protein
MRSHGGPEEKRLGPTRERATHDGATMKEEVNMAVKVDPSTLTKGTLIEVEYGSRGTQIALVRRVTAKKVYIDRFKGHDEVWMGINSPIDHGKVRGLAEERDPRTIAARKALQA